MQIYYINLARRTDRRSFMEEQFAGLGLEATRIEAVTPDELTDADWRPPGKRRDDRLAGRALCCSLSHFRALETMCTTEAPWALILEDDAVLSARLPAFLAAIETAPIPARVIRIEAAVRANLTLFPHETMRVGVGLHRYAGWDIGAAGYLISREGAQMVLATKGLRRHEVDLALFHDFTVLSRRLKPLQANPALCIQAENLQNGHQPHARSDLADDRLPATRARRIAYALHRDLVQGPRKVWWRIACGGRRLRVPFAAE